MASKSIDWDELLLTNDPKKKEIEVSFKKIDGEGYISFGDPPGTPPVTEGPDGGQPDTDDEGDFEDDGDPTDNTDPIAPDPDNSDCEAWDCAKWREYEDAGYDQTQWDDPDAWSTRVAKFYVTQREVEIKGEEALQRKIQPAFGSTKNRSPGGLMQWKNFIDTASPFYAFLDYRNNNDRKLGGEANYNDRKDWDQHIQGSRVAVGADFDSPFGPQAPEDFILCDATAHQPASSSAGKFASDMDFAWNLNVEPYLSDGLWDFNNKYILEGEGFVAGVTYGWDGYPMFDKVHSGYARGFSEGLFEYHERMHNLKISDQMPYPFAEQRFDGTRQWWEKRTYAGLFATNSNSSGTYMAPTYLPTYENNPSTNSPTLQIGVPQITVPYMPAQLVGTEIVAPQNENDPPSYRNQEHLISGSAVIYFYHNAIVIRTYDTSNVELNKYGWTVFEKDWWPSNKPFMGWITLDHTVHFTADSTVAPWNAAYMEHNWYEDSELDIYINGSSLLDKVPLTSVPEHSAYRNGDPNYPNPRRSFAFFNNPNTGTLEYTFYGSANSDRLGHRDTSVGDIASDGMVCLALYEGPDAKLLPRSRFGRAVLRQFGNPETYPIYCERVPS